MKQIGKYLREISIVVTGIAITLSASYWITQRAEKRDLSLYLNAIRLELEDNIKELDREAEYLEDWENYAIYLALQDKKTLNPDSIRTEAYPGLGYIETAVFQTSAFEMFKASGYMRLMDDKELLQSVWKAYLELEKCRLSIDFYFELKKAQCLKENQLKLEGKQVSIPLYDFFVTYINTGAMDECQKISNYLKGMVTRLKKYK
ncbi:MAG: hypothetical protein LBG92_00120 [Prevotellaceae bacterium]|jgi:hypothetical protein|nr:hypothetical protein [Prevotellaceae bacterium]